MSDSKSPPSGKSTLLPYWPVLSTLGVALFAFGGGWASHNALADRIEDVDDKVAYHQDSRNHPDNTSRVDLLTLRIDRLERSQAKVESDVTEVVKTQQQIIRKIDQLCASVPMCSVRSTP